MSRHSSTLFCFFAGAAIVFAAEPNFIKSTLYNVDGASSNIVSTVYSDGLGRDIQGKVSLGAKDRAVSTFYDGAGRKNIVTKPYLDSTSPGNFNTGDFDNINEILKVNYSKYPTVSGDPFAYSQVEYYSDGRVKRATSPGKDNRLGSGHEVKNWYFAVAKEIISINLTPGHVLFKDGFISSLTEHTGFDTSQVLDSLYELFNSKHIAFVNNPTHFLTVIMGPTRTFSQGLKDAYQRTVATKSDLSPYDKDEIIAEYEYSPTGLLLEEIAPKDLANISHPTLISNTIYSYNSLNQVIRKQTPDGTIDSLVYDDAGNLKSKKSFYLNSLNEEVIFQYLHYVYDDFSRLVKTQGIDLSRDMPQDYILNYYDNVDELLLSNDGFGIPSDIFQQLTNLRGRLVASVSCNSLNGKMLYISDLYSYNDDGNVSTKFKIVPELPIQQITYTYDIHGKITDEEITCGINVIEKHYNFDQFGRLLNIVHKNNGNKELVKYDYDDFGLVYNKKLNTSHNITYQYTIEDWVKELNSTGALGFKEELTYLPDGNINIAKSSYKNATTEVYTNTYSYDNLNRLKAVSSSDTAYTANYTYDPIGRFKTKKEGSDSIQNYTYYNNTSRLKYSRDLSRKYIFDQKGNLIVDPYKKLVIRYDWRDMPVQFLFYKSIPSTVTTDIRGSLVINDFDIEEPDLYKYMEQLSKKDLNYALITTVSNLYDASGNRVLKMDSMQ